MPKALTPQQKRLKVMSKQMEVKPEQPNEMTSEEAKQAQELGFLKEMVPNNRGEEARHSHSDIPRTENERPGRDRQRGGFSGTKLKLSVEKTIPGYHMHIFNDDGIRIQEALAIGWEFVAPNEVGKVSPHVTSRNVDLGDKVKYLVGKEEGGGPLYGYLMKIRQEWWEEDQAELQSRSDKIDDAILAGRDKDGKQGDGFYAPKSANTRIKHELK